MEFNALRNPKNNLFIEKQKIPGATNNNPFETLELSKMLAIGFFSNTTQQVIRVAKTKLINAAEEKDDLIVEIESLCSGMCFKIEKYVPTFPKWENRVTSVMIILKTPRVSAS